MVSCETFSTWRVRPVDPRSRASNGTDLRAGFHRQGMRWLLVAIEQSRTAGYGAANEDTIETPSTNERRTDGLHRSGSRALLICSSTRRPRGLPIGLEQDARPGQLARRPLPLATAISTGPFLDRQPHHEFLVHDRLPSQNPGETPGLDKSPRTYHTRLTGH